MSGAAWLILPTFDEADNVEAIVDAAVAVLERAVPGGFHVLIVDDDSPDGTGALADRLAARYEAVEVLHRPDRSGLGAAYLSGFRHALAAGASRVLQMDADFSHDAADMARLLEAVDAGADVALGSRYVTGGGVADWGIVRRVVSRVGCSYARVGLGLEIRDLTGGSKCFRREVLETIDLDTVRARGYAFQVELSYRALKAGFRVVEVPILFRDRRLGRSKMSWSIAGEAIGACPSRASGVGSERHAQPSSAALLRSPAF